MLKFVTALLGLAFFGAVFAEVIYDPDPVVRELGNPRYGLAPGALAADFIEPLAPGENVTVNITVLNGGPIHVYLMDIENLTLHGLNTTEGALELAGDFHYDRAVSRFNVTDHHNFTFVTDGETRWALVLESAMVEDPDEDPQNQTTEIAVQMRYVDREMGSLIAGYFLATPSVVLLFYTLYLYLDKERAKERAKRRPSGGADDPGEARKGGARRSLDPLDHEL